MYNDIETAIGAANGAQLDGLAREIWGAYSRQEIEEDRANALSAAIEARRRAFFNSARVSHGKGSLPLLTHPRPKYGHARRAASLERRRRWAASGALPPTLAVHYTTGELAVLTVIARQVQRTGSCDWPMEKIAALAGVCRSTARNALRRARDLGHLSVLERRIDRWRSDTNVVQILSPEWRQWLRLQAGGGGHKKLIPTGTSSHSVGSAGGQRATASRFSERDGRESEGADRLPPHPRR